MGTDMVFIQLPGPDIRNKPLPDTGTMPGGQRMPGIVPAVESPLYRHGPGIGGPHGKINPLLHGMGPEFVIQTEMAAFIEQKNVIITQPGGTAGQPVVLFQSTVVFFRHVSLRRFSGFSQ